MEYNTIYKYIQSGVYKKIQSGVINRFNQVYINTFNQTDNTKYRVKSNNINYI